MFRAMKLLAMLTTILIVGCASAPSGMSFDSPIGEWNEKYTSKSGKTRSSRVTFIDETKGTYTNPNGRLEIYEIDDQGRWKAYWIEESVPANCTEEKSGSMHWGEQMFQFNDTFNQYTGWWDSCGEGPKYPFKGVR